MEFDFEICIVTLNVFGQTSIPASVVAVKTLQIWPRNSFSRKIKANGSCSSVI